jgi:hypothetical protein
MPRRSPRALLVAVTLLIFPLLAIPAYLVGVDVGGAVDKDRTNGVFPLAFILGLGDLVQRGRLHRVNACRPPL